MSCGKTCAIASALILVVCGIAIMILGMMHQNLMPDSLDKGCRNMAKSTECIGVLHCYCFYLSQQNTRTARMLSDGVNVSMCAHMCMHESCLSLCTPLCVWCPFTAVWEKRPVAMVSSCINMQYPLLYSSNRVLDGSYVYHSLQAHMHTNTTICLQIYMHVYMYMCVIVYVASSVYT